ncbi:penicillin-insensitive murein endopeptidase [Massilia endophytica]|uniref:penicillin-insensitive murein endopeptidase n=1 Tax=Massilia endophytica TaxID=2899220 RepID=UPI001E3F8A2B|nr:penicillin-insensitive murein endopeptidase [Massilia endophytica]UGQ45591.1 penicillin-insensitive murein endopeptidase [Massilia endophytica]
MVLEVQPKDARGYFMLPQAPEEAGYYVYGTPAGGAGQFAHSALLSMVNFVEREWQATEARKFGVGNISLENGGKYKKHDSHKNGLQIDIRALRKDGQHLAVSRFDHQYDQDSTAKLISIFLAYPSVRLILFNDIAIHGVRPWPGHDDHFHVGLRAVTK